MADHAQSIQAVCMRVTRLTASGAPVTGSKSYWTSDQFISFGYTPEMESGEDIRQKAANGRLCATFKTDDVLVRITSSLAICNPEPELRQLLMGGTLLAPAGDPTSVIGWGSPQVGEIAQPNGVGIELWSKAIVDGKPAAVNPYWYYMFPYHKFQPDGTTTLENGLTAQQFTGWGVGNVQFNGGPVNSWPFSTSLPYAFARTSTFPNPTNDWN